MRIFEPAVSFPIMKTKSKSAADGTPVDWDVQPLEWPRAVGQVDLLVAALEKRQQRLRRRRTAVGAGALLMVVGFCFLWLPRMRDTAQLPAVASTSLVVAPERRILPDGSLVELKPGAHIEVGFSATSAGPRAVTLQRGVAHFQVAKNPDRPFVVMAGGVAFRAVGTAFAVDVGSASVELLVTEGRVAVETGARLEAPLAAVALADAGDRVRVGLMGSATPQVTRVSGKEFGEVLAWRVPRLELNATPLREVIEALNRHGDHRIRFGTDDLGAVEVSGALRADALDPLLEMLARNYRIQAVRSANGDVVLQRRQ